MPADVDVLLGDSMGELPVYYAAADVAFVGGSLLPLGGQNLIEPIALGVPTLVGPHTFNFAEATRRGDRGGRRAAGRATPDALVDAVGALLRDDAARGRRCARAAHDVHARRTAAPPTGCGRGSRRACRARQPRSRRLISSRSSSVSVPTADLSRSTPTR